MALVSLLVLLVNALVVSVVGLSNFTQPPPAGPNANYQDNPVYQQGQKIDVQWRSNLDSMDLILFQQYPAAGKGVQYLRKLRQGTRSTSLIWSVSLAGLSKNVPKGDDAILYFAVMPAKSPNKDGMSHYFNVTVADGAAATTESTISMTTASVSDLPTGTAAPSTTATPPPESSGVASSGLSKGAVAGVAVGSTAAGILLLGGIGWLAWRKRKTPAQTDDAPEQLVDESQVKPPELGGPTVHEAPTPTPSQPRPPTPIYEAP